MSRLYKDGRDTPGGGTDSSMTGAKSALMIRMPQELKDALLKEARKAKRSMNNYVCWLLDKALKSKEKVKSTTSESAEEQQDEEEPEDEG